MSEFRRHRGGGALNLPIRQEPGPVAAPPFACRLCMLPDVGTGTQTDPLHLDRHGPSMARRTAERAGEGRPPAGPGRDVASARAVRRSRDLLEELFGPPRDRPFAVRFWTGEEDRPAADPDFTLVLRRPDALRRMLLPPTERSLGEAYLRDDCDVRGDLEAAAGVFRELLEDRPSLARLPRLLSRLLALPRAAAGDGGLPEGPDRSGTRHSRGRDSRAVRFHYDAGNRFFGLWLDPYMQYSSAYFPAGDETLEEAQEAKLELLCRKLRLEPGHTLLDVGCGWGGLIRYAAERHGVRALGVTLSEPQARRARRDLEASGLDDRCRVRVLDYRDLAGRKRFDRVVSVGMVEHVGRRRMGRYFGQARRLLRDEGLFLSVGIVSLAPPPTALGRALAGLRARYGSFVDRHVFPDGELVAPSVRHRPAERAGLRLRHAEELGEHYAETLRRWVDRLEARRREVLDLAGRTTYRTWRLYMAASAHAFSSGRLGLLHSLFEKA